jgi:organic hydroperoxide reductase OsmC/OhrA
MFMRRPDANAPCEAGIGDFHGAKESSQAFSLEGQNPLEFRVARYAFGSGKAEHHRGHPPEFTGERQIWAPEELLVGSLNTCMMLTFLTLAQAQGLTPVGYESEAEGSLENVEGKYHMTEVEVRPHVTLKSEAELEPARKTMESVEAHCFIANSINAKVTLTPEFVVAPPPK